MRISPSVNENLCYMLIETLLIYKSSITTKENFVQKINLLWKLPRKNIGSLEVFGILLSAVTLHCSNWKTSLAANGSFFWSVSSFPMIREDVFWLIMTAYRAKGFPASIGFLLLLTALWSLGTITSQWNLVLLSTDCYCFLNWINSLLVPLFRLHFHFCVIQGIVC